METKQELIEALQGELKTFKDNLPAYATVADMERKMADIEAKYKSLDAKAELAEIKKAIEAQGVELAKMSTPQAGAKVKSMREFLTTSKALDKLKNREQSEFEVKTVGDVTTANVVDAVTQPVLSILGVQGDVYAVNRSIQASILDEVDMGTTDKATIVYVDEVNGEGSIATTSEGVSKSQIDVDYQEVTVNAIKKTGLVKVTEEALDDISYMEGEITRVLNEKLQIAEAADVLADIVTNATTFSLTDYDDAVVAADIIDAIVAATVQSELSGFMPTAIVMHPVDVAAFQMIKSSNIPRVSTEAGRLMVNGLKVVKATQITKGTFVLGDLKKYRVRRYKTKLVMGWDADDFSKNKRTLIAESRYLKYISSNEKTSLVKGTFATIIAALLKP